MTHEPLSGQSNLWLADTLWRLGAVQFGDFTLGYIKRAVLGANGVTVQSVDDLTTDLARTRDRTRAALGRVSFEGVAGRILFDEHGDVRRGVAMMAVEPGRPPGDRRRLFGWLGEH